MIRFAARRRGIAKTRSGISGALASRPSTSAKAASSSGPERQRREHAGRAPAEGVGAHDPVDGADRPPVTSSAPDASKLRGRHSRRLSGTIRRRETITAIPTGTLIRKIAGQPKALREQAAEQHAEAAAEAAHRAPHAERAVALAALGERGRDDREARGRDDRAAEALQRARADQQRRASSPARKQRSEREQRRAGEEHAPAAEQVGRAPAEHQKAAEGDRVGVHDPLQPRRREAEAVADRRQRDVDDRDVEDDHELRQADEHEQHALARPGTGAALAGRLCSGDAPRWRRRKGSVVNGAAILRYPSFAGTMTIVAYCSTIVVQSGTMSSTTPDREEIELPGVLHALSDPQRLHIVAARRRPGAASVRQLRARRDQVDGDAPLPRAPRGRGDHQRERGTTKLTTLRREDLDERFPGLLDAVLASPDAGRRARVGEARQIQRGSGVAIAQLTVAAVRGVRRYARPKGIAASGGEQG